MITRDVLKKDDLTLLIVDLDNTLYDASSGVFQRMDQRMTAYIQQSLGVAQAKANELRQIYWHRYGTTLRGLMLHHQVDAEDFLFHVHEVQADELLSHDAILQQALEGIAARKVIHTNGTREHAQRILQCLGVSQYFSHIYDIRFNDYQPKPCAHTLALLLAQEQVEACKVMVIDDMSANLQVARQLGMRTCKVGEHEVNENEPWDMHISHFHQIGL